MQSLRSVPLQAFCSSTRQWVPLSSLVPDSAESKSTISPTKPFTVITYNVFAGPGSENLPHLSHRTKGVLSILERSKADVIALQEVSLGFERSLRREKWLRAQWVITSLQDYFLSSTHGLSHTLNARNGDDGCLLAIRRALIDEDIQTEAEMLRLSGSQGKVLVSAQTVNGIRFATNHFESLSSSSSTRLAQYQETLSSLQGYPSAVILGDFNHAVYGELACLIGTQDSPGHFTDATIPPMATGKRAIADWQFRQAPTFGELYPFVGEGRERRKSRRLDLILFKTGQFDILETWSTGEQALKVQKRQSEHPPLLTKTGKVRKPKIVPLKCREGLRGLCYPSDHLAVSAKLQWKAPQKI